MYCISSWIKKYLLRFVSLQNIYILSSLFCTIVFVHYKPTAFSVALAYRVLHNIQRGDLESDLLANVWTFPVLSKAKLLIWRLCLNGLPTLDNLRIRNCIDVTKNGLFPLCRAVTETVVHLFLTCSLVEGVWKQWIEWLDIWTVFPDEVHMHIKM